MLGTCGLGRGFLSHSDPGLKLPGQGRWLNVPAQDHSPRLTKQRSSHPWQARSWRCSRTLAGADRSWEAVASRGSRGGGVHHTLLDREFDGCKFSLAKEVQMLSHATS